MVSSNKLLFYQGKPYTWVSDYVFEDKHIFNVSDISGKFLKLSIPSRLMPLQFSEHTLDQKLTAIQYLLNSSHVTVLSGEL